jgi:hypothetical protein
MVWLRACGPVVFAAILLTGSSHPRALQSLAGTDPTADCSNPKTHADEFICRDDESRRLASTLDESIAAAIARVPANAATVRADQADWKRMWDVPCARLDPRTTTGLDLTECLRLVLRHRVEVLESGLLYRGAAHYGEVETLPNLLGALPTARRRKYSFRVASISAQYFESLVGDFYMSDTELLVTRLRGVFKLAFAGMMPEVGDEYLSGGRVYRVLNAREVRAANPPTPLYDERFEHGLCHTDSRELRWLIVRVDQGFGSGPFVKLSQAYIHDYLDLATRAYGSCGTFYIHLAS